MAKGPRGEKRGEVEEITDPPPIYCVSCGKSHREVAKIIVMNSVTSAICNECIELLHDILHEEENHRPPEPQTP